MKKWISLPLTFSLLAVVFLSASCSTPNVAVASEAAVTFTSAPPTPIPPATVTLTPTETPTETATLPPKGGEVLTAIDVKSVPADVVTAIDSVNLTEDDGLRWTYSQKHEKYGKMDENGELKYVVYPMQYFVDGKETIVNMPMYVSSTDGGAMSVMSGIAKGDGEHGAWVVNGSDENARNFFKWVTNDELWKQQNPFLIDALAKVAKGELNIEFVYADTNLLPENLKAALAQNKEISEPKLFGQETGWMRDVPTGNLMHIYPKPFIQGNKLIIFQLRDIKYLMNREEDNKSRTDRLVSDFLMEASFWNSTSPLESPSWVNLRDLAAKEMAKLIDVHTIQIK
jgi:hypothetical protein